MRKNKEEKGIWLILFNYTSYPIFVCTKDATKECKNITEFKKWFLNNHFQCKINYAFRVLKNEKRIPLKELTDFATSRNLNTYKYENSN